MLILKELNYYSLALFLWTEFENYQETDVMELQQNDLYWKLLKSEVQKKKVIDVFNLFRANNFEPILIKGWAASQNYSNSYERWSVDIDLAIDPKDYEKCLRFIQKNKLEDVDIHNGLRRHDLIEWNDLYDNSRLIKIKDTEIRVLRPEDHLRVLCVHWLTDGGAHKERLWDIYYAVENRPADFDWDRCLNIVSPKRRKWIICTIGLAHKYLGLDLEDTPLEGQVEDIPRWITKTVEREWASGIKLKSLDNCLYDRAELFRQIKKRLPPNPILATVDMEGDFDNKPRIFYQIGDVFYRLKPSVKRIFKRLSRKNSSA